MANTKDFYTRIQNKHDTEANWNKATNFTPLAGEIIIYDSDNNNSVPRIKIGDGSSPLANLPFTTDIYYTEDEIDEMLGNIDWFSRGTAIPANSDLNDYTTAGKYYASPGATAQSLMHCPTGKDNFVLYVFLRTKLGAITQLIITIQGKMYIRNANESGVWETTDADENGWRRYTTTADLSELIPKMTKITLSASNWSNNTQTINLSGILSDETKQLITVAPYGTVENTEACLGILCTGQAQNTLTFTAINEVPATDVEFIVSWQEVNYI